MYDSNSIITLDRRLSESQMRKHIIQLEQNNQRQKEIIQNLRTQLNACNRKTISVQSDQVHDEDAVLITCKNLKRILYQQSANQKCTFCANEVQEVVIQKRTGRFLLHYKCKKCERIVKTCKTDVNWNEGNGGITRKFAQAMTASGVNYWQYKRFSQYCNLYYLREAEWRFSNNHLSRIVRDLTDEYISLCREIATSLSPEGCAGSYDMAWSHRMRAPYGSGCVVECHTRSVIARYHCCKRRNAADPTAPVYTDTPASMEAHAANKCFSALVQEHFKLCICAFDGDASTYKHFYSSYPDARATRDPNHIAKNVYKQLLAIYGQLKYACTCCEREKDANGKLKKKRKHNVITKEKAKSGQVWVGQILRETKKVDDAKKLLYNYLEHLTGKCKPGNGCKHKFPHVHSKPVNCAEMEERIRSYFDKEIIDIMEKIIMDGEGAVDTNTNESVNELMHMMRDKIRVLGAALYCARTDIAYLMQNQKCVTRHRPGARRHFLAELLQRTGHEVTQHQVDTWISEAVQKNIKGDTNREPEQKQRKMNRRFGNAAKQTNNHTGKDCDDFYHSGGKSVGDVIDLLQDNGDEDEDNEGNADLEEREHYPTDIATVKKFSTKTLKVICQQLIGQVGGDVALRTKDIPTQGNGQKKAWFDLCMTLIAEQGLMKLHVPVSVCPQQNRLVDAVGARGVSVLCLHPTVHKVRVKFKDKCSLIIFFDLESTGLGIYQAQIIQFGAVAALARTGKPLHLLGTYCSFVTAKMRFPADVTRLTGIRHWYHKDSQLKGAPTLSEVNNEVQSKICEWRQTANTLCGETVYGQLIGWNSDSFDIPLWSLQTDEVDGEGSWSRRFLGEHTGLVACTDLYRLTRHAGFVPKSVQDISEYAMKEKQRGVRKKKNNDKQVQLVQFDSPQAAILAYINLVQPGEGSGMSLALVTTCLQKHDNQIGSTLDELIPIAQANLAEHKKARRKRKRQNQTTPATATRTTTRKGLRWVPPSNLGKFHTWLLGRRIEGYHGALQDSQALFDIFCGKVRLASEMYDCATKKEENKHVAKSLALKYKQTQIRARQKAKESHGRSRFPYGKSPGKCIGHGYPCSMAIEKRKQSCYYGKTYECCNWGFKSRICPWDDRRCGHKVVF